MALYLQTPPPDAPDTGPRFLLQAGPGPRGPSPPGTPLTLQDLTDPRVNPLLQAGVGPGSPQAAPVHTLAWSPSTCLPLVGPDAQGQLWTWLGEGEEEVQLYIDGSPRLALQVRGSWAPVVLPFPPHIVRGGSRAWGLTRFAIGAL